jgi:hypothetical protein
VRDQYAFVFGSLRKAAKTVAICLSLSMGAVPALPKGIVDFVPLGNWAVVESLAEGSSISVRMTSGDKMEGKFLGLDADCIRLKMDNQDRIFPRAGVAEVRQLGVKDKKLNGILIGMGAGAGAGVIAATAWAGNEASNAWSGEDAIGPALVLAGLGLGALIGGTTDAVMKGSKLLYRK